MEDVSKVLTGDTFHKRDLRPGKHVVKLNDHTLNIVMYNNVDKLIYLMDLTGTERVYTQGMNEDMVHTDDSGCTISHVYTISSCCAFIDIEKFLELTWQRYIPIREVTMKEVCEAFGETVKIKGVKF